MLLFVDNLTNVDFSFLDPERGLVGETWMANIRLHGELDPQSMICDFGVVKKRVRHWLDTELDHRLAIPTQARNLELREDGDTIHIHWGLTDGSHITCSGPRQAFALVNSASLTADTIGHWCTEQLSANFNEHIEQLELAFTTELIDGAFYHYSHGLKKHAGNCQRIAHGHRSRIDIWANGEKSPALERQWAERWRDIYIGTREDITASAHIAGTSYYDFAYTSQQGYFSLQIPQSRCDIIDTDTTVECLAAHITQTCKAQNPQSSIRVKAYEGINKGAECSA